MSISLKINLIYGTVAGFTLLHLGVCIGRWLSLLVFIRKRIFVCMVTFEVSSIGDNNSACGFQSVKLIRHYLLLRYQNFG